MQSSLSESTGLKILYVVNDIEYFLAHRAALARGIESLGHEVIIAAGDHWGEARPEDFPGLEHIPFDIDRQAFSISGDFQLMRTFSKIIKKHKPDVVHSITIKPNLYIALAATILLPRLQSKSIRFVMTFAGLGKIFEVAGGAWLRVRRSMVERALRFAATRLNLGVTFENRQDMDTLLDANVFSRGQCRVMMGAGIDLELYKPNPKSGRLRILLASRLIAEKGVDTYLAVARRFHDSGADMEFLLAGALVETNPDAISPDLIRDSETNGSIIYKQYIQPADMPSLLADIDVVCLPTRLQEGLPRILLEAAASGCALIASDQPACRTIVHHGETGWLLSTPDEECLFQAIEGAFYSIAETRLMGRRARVLAQQLPIGHAQIRDQFLQIYCGSYDG